LSLALLLTAPPRTLVVPFDNLSPEGTNGWVGEAIADSLSSHLRLVGQEVVSSDDRQRLLREKGLEPDTPPTLAILVEVGQELGARRVVMGSFRDEGGRLEVTAQIIDVGTGDKVGVIEDHGKLEELPEIENQLAKNLLRLEGGRVPEDYRLAATRRKELPLEAHEAYVRAKLSRSPTERRNLLASALATYPSYADAALLLGQVLLEQDDLERAIEVLSSIPPEDPAYREAYFTMGVVYLEADQTRLAVEIFGRLAEQEKAACFLNNLAVAYLRRGEIERAVITFREAVEQESSRGLYSFNLGWSAWRAERTHEARHSLTEAARLEPEDAEAHLLLSAIAASEDEPEEAEKEREAARSLSPELDELDPSSLESLERVVERLPAGLANYRFSAPVVEAPPTEPGEPEVAAHDTDDPEKSLEEARSLRASGDLEKAVRQFERAVYLDPHAVEIRFELAEVYQEMGDLEKAARELRVVLWNREDAPTLLRVAEIYEAMGEIDKALTHAERAAELDREDPDTRELLERLKASQP
jgi:tetratricopeptide (TPR) repeat protein